jgi:NAD(P)-dependent dehydrogenase (short-subunit alcohol dehydrogenase family)
MDHNLNGRTALVTGASRGLGKQIAISLAGAGANVALVGRDRKKLEEAASEARTAGGNAEFFCTDITSEDQVSQLEQDVQTRLGPIQILVNNAGVNVRKPVTELTLDEWRYVIDTNLTGAFLMCRAFVPQMRGTGYGRILNMTSMMSHVSLPHRTAYSSSKAGLLGFTRALALELAADGITVVGISPGPFATEMNTALMENPEANRMFLSRIPVGRWGIVSDLGKLVLYLCSEEAGFITGTDIVIDGGWCAQ